MALFPTSLTTAGDRLEHRGCSDLEKIPEGFGTAAQLEVGMKKTALFGILFFLPMDLSAEEPIEWAVSRSGGSTIEIPSFLTEGWVTAILDNGVDRGTVYEAIDHRISLRQYRTQSTKRPYVYLVESFDKSINSITYIVDKDRVGAISGFMDEGNRTIYHSMCRKSNGPLRCIDLEYAADEKAFFDPIVSRISKSFKE